MQGINTFLGGGGNYLSPLISFYTFLDLDTGLMNLIEDEYFDETTFNVYFYMMDKIDQIYNLYFRTVDNPLEVIGLNPEENKETLQGYYKQFLTKEYENILEKSYTTGIYDFLELSLESIEIRPTILCYDELQEERFRLFTEFKDIETVNIKDLRPDNYTQFYIKELAELKPFIDLECKTFYIASFGPNLTDEFREFKPIAYFEKLIKNKNEISMFGMYDYDIIGKPDTLGVDKRKEEEETEKKQQGVEDENKDN